MPAAQALPVDRVVAAAVMGAAAEALQLRQVLTPDPVGEAEAIAAGPAAVGMEGSGCLTPFQTSQEPAAVERSQELMARNREGPTLQFPQKPADRGVSAH